MTRKVDTKKIFKSKLNFFIFVSRELQYGVPGFYFLYVYIPRRGTRSSVHTQFREVLFRKWADLIVFWPKRI